MCAAVTVVVEAGSASVATQVVDDVWQRIKCD